MDKIFFLSKTRAYISWQQMKLRCCDLNNPAYSRYGGRGIKVCKRWLEGFKNFYDDMGERPKNMTLDRINNEDGYYKENCRWTDSKEQNRNRRCTIKINYNNEIKSLGEWSEKLGIKYSILFDRIFTYKWDIKDAFEKPVDTFSKQNRFIEINNIKKTVTELAKEYKLPFYILHKRLFKHNWELQRALNEPVIRGRRRKNI